MKSFSFRVVPRGLIPRQPWYKQALLASLFILAGCGGSPHAKPVAIRGHGFSFNAPAGWKVTASATSTSVTHDSELLQVSTFPLIRAYSDALFDKVKTELDVRMASVAKDDAGAVSSSRTVTVAGGRAHRYDVTAGKDLLEYTFVLRGKREFELLCRRPSSESDSTCAQLLATFTTDL